MKKILSIIIMGLLISCSFGVQGVFFENLTDKTTTTDFGDIFFNLKMEILMKLAEFPSLSACVIEGDEVTWSNGYGFYDLENRKPATENTIYNIASITKTITGTALMQLWEQGLFGLDEDVNNYLPFNLRNPHFPDDPISFRMLLSHSSSLNPESLSYNGYYWLNFSDDPPFTFYPYPWLEEHLIPEGILYYPQRWSYRYGPGEYNVYANVNFDIVAYLVELISGEIFVEYCKNHIFNPLEMYNTSFNLSELDIDNVAIPYHYHDGEYLHINELAYLLGKHTPPPDKYWRILNIPVGGLYSTVSDLSHFFIAHMNGGIWKGVRILEEDTVEEMHRIQPPGNLDSHGLHYGLGWTNQDQKIFDVTLSGHTGGNFGVHTLMYYSPDENVGVIFFINGDVYYEQKSVVTSIANSLIIINLFKKSGVNIWSYIDFRNNGAE